MSAHVAVIGAGPGGYAAAFYAADLGMKVTLIDNEKNPGGVCLYRGCIPSKALLHVAKVLDESKHAVEWGIEFGAPKVDVNKLRDFKNRVVDKLTSGTGQVSKFRKVNYLQGWASIVDAKTIKVKKNGGGEETVSADYLILALGSLPTKIPALTSDSPRVLDSTSALDLPEVPKSMLVVGGGYIGLELGSVYAALGTRVSVVEMTPGLLPGADRDLVRYLAQRVEKTFEKVMLSTKVTSMNASASKCHGDVRGRGCAEGSHLRLRAGVDRPPAQRERSKASTGPRSRSTPRGSSRSTASGAPREPTIFAIGDVAGEPMLAHKASHEARVAVEAIAGQQGRRLSRAAIPAVVFTDPEIAWCGLTETEARERRVARSRSRSSRGPPRAARSPSIAPRGSPSSSSSRRPSAFSASASSARRRRTDRRRRARGRDGRHARSTSSSRSIRTRRSPRR